MSLEYKKTKRKITLAPVMIACLVLILFSESFSAELNLSSRTQENAALRSAVLPGWGQLFNGNRSKAIVFASAEIILAGASYYYYSRADNTYSDYKAKGAADDPLYADYEDEQRMAVMLTAGAAAVWIFAIIDAYVFSPYSERYTSLFKDKFRLETGRGRLVLDYKVVRL